MLLSNTTFHLSLCQRFGAISQHLPSSKAHACFVRRGLRSMTSNMSIKRISFKVDGQVQGVNFRSFAQKQAKRIGLAGFVTNVSDGSVQGEAQGSGAAIDEFVQQLNKGPPAASVSGVAQSVISTKSDEDGFNVK